MLSDDESINNIGIWQLTGVSGGAMGKAFMKGYSRLKSPPQKEQLSRPDKILLAYYFHFVLRMNASVEELRGNPRGVSELLTISYHVGRALHKEPIVSNTSLMRRIQKLGDYYGAARAITKALGTPIVFGLRKAIRFTEVTLSSFILACFNK
jgi:hypothetical protein